MRDTPERHASPKPPSTPVVHALWAGAATGLVVGAGDALAASRLLSQFVPTLGGKIACAAHAGALHALLLGLFAAVAAAGLVGLWRHTRVAGLVHTLGDAHARVRARDPRLALGPLAYTIAALPLVGLALRAAQKFGVHTIATRHHQGLIALVIMATTVVALGGALVVALPAARLVEAALRPLARGRLGRLLSSPWAPLVATVALAIAAGAAVAAITWETLVQLPLRRMVVTLVAVALLPLAWRAVAPLVRRMGRRTATARAALAALLAGALTTVTLATGGDDGIRKAAGSFTAWTSPLTRVLLAFADLDRDGYSALLGGGDCNDLDRTIHQGAVDIPDDGIDQNCIGGDRTSLLHRDAPTFTAVPKAVPGRLSFLLVTIDTVRSDHFSTYGYDRETTPHIDAVAREGTVFINSWAHAPSTRFSIPAIITGRYPTQVLWDRSMWWPGLLPENHTIGEIMKESGRATGAVLNYRYFEEKRRFGQGIDSYDNENARLHAGKDPASTSGTSSREQTDKAIAFVDTHAEEPFFLWVHYYDPHYKYERHPGTKTFGNKRLDLYDHEIRFTDDQIGRLFDRVKELGLWDRTAVVITGDHGEGFGEHGVDLHGYHLYAAQTRVPLIMRVPGLPSQRLTLPAGHVDILPTLANLVGAKADKTMAGASLVDALAGRAPAESHRAVFQELFLDEDGQYWAAANDRCHLIYNAAPKNTFELYDVTDDPNEEHDIHGKTDCNGLEEQLLAWVETAGIPPEAAGAAAEARLERRPKPRVPVTATLGGSVGLLGADFPTAPLKPGQSFDLTLYFESLRQVTLNWEIFVHVEGPRRFLGDHEAVGGMLPVNRWKVGDFIEDRTSIQVPANAGPGEYSIYLGMYTSKSRLAVTDAGEHDAGQDRIKVGTLVVKR